MDPQSFRGKVLLNIIDKLVIGVIVGLIVMFFNNQNDRYLRNGHLVILKEMGHSREVSRVQPEAFRHLAKTFYLEGIVDDSKFKYQPMNFKPSETFQDMAKDLVSKQSRDERLIDYINEFVDDDEVPGIQYVIVDRNNILFSHAKGWADIKNQVPMTLKTTMMVYSTTKVLTAAAILKLFDQGKLHLKDTIDKYLPDIPYKEEITIQQVLSHTSGIPNPNAIHWFHFMEEHDDFDRKALLQKILGENTKLDFSPGAKYQYSNLGYVLLGEVIERVSGLSYEDYMRKEIYSPLEISGEEMDFVHHKLSNHATGYIDSRTEYFKTMKGFLGDILTDSGERWERVKKYWYMSLPAHGGMIASSVGFVKFLQDQLSQTSRLFSDKTKKLFYIPQKNKERKPVGVALGWHIVEIDEIQYFSPSGGGFGYQTEIRIYPSMGIASVIIVNRTNFPFSSTLDRLDREFFMVNFNSHTMGRDK